MPNYQLIVRGEYGKYTRGNCAVYDLSSTTLEEAVEESKRRLYGDRSQWKVEWGRRFSGENREPVLQLDPEDSIRMTGNILFEDEEEVVAAWVVESHHVIDLGALRKEMSDFKDAGAEKLGEDPEYQQYLALKKKFG